VRGLAALAALLLASCGTSNVCAGEQQGTLVFSFQAACAGGTACSAANPTPPAGSCSFFATLVQDALKTPPINALPTTRFTASVSWRGPAVAALCVQAPLAVDKLGTYAATGVNTWSLDIPASVPVTAPPGAVGACPCDVDILENLSGTLTRDAEQKLAFSGSLSAVLGRNAADAKCYTDKATATGMADCPPAGGSCTVDYVSP
jgi:hypothetical protein